MSDHGEIKAKRQAAMQARRLAWEFAGQEDRERVLTFAAELEAQADALEQATPPAPRVTQIQMQMQQGPPTRDDDKSEP